MRYPWNPTFRIRELVDGWDDSPSDAGVYVISCGRSLKRVGGIDRAGITYVGKSLCLRDRLWTYWEGQHEASGMFWDMPGLARAIFGPAIRRSGDIDRALGSSLVWVASPIPREALSAAERAVLFAYMLRFLEPPPLNATLPERWGGRPPDLHLSWAAQGLDPRRLALQSTRRQAPVIRV